MNKTQREARKHQKSGTRGLPRKSKKGKVTNQKGAFGRKFVLTDYYTGGNK